MDWVFDIDGNSVPRAIVQLAEKAPPSPEAEKWILDNKERFKKRYGKNYAKYLYGKAWELYPEKDAKHEASHTVEIQKDDEGNTKITQKTAPSGNTDFQVDEFEMLDEAIRMQIDHLVLLSVKEDF